MKLEVAAYIIMLGILCDCYLNSKPVKEKCFSPASVNLKSTKSLLYDRGWNISQLDVSLHSYAAL